MSILNNNMDTPKAYETVKNAILRAKSAEIRPWVWIYRNPDLNETVEFVMGKAESHYIYTRFKSFLGFKFGVERFTLSSDDLNFVDWHALGDVVNSVNPRFGYGG